MLTDPDARAAPPYRLGVRWQSDTPRRMRGSTIVWKARSPTRIAGRIPGRAQRVTAQWRESHTGRPTPAKAILRSGAGLATHVEHRLGAAILRPAGDVVADRDRPLLAVGDGADARGANALLGQEVTHVLRALGAEADVVFPRAALVGVALDRDGVLGILLQPARLIGERLLGFRRQVDLISGEVHDIADVGGEIPCRAGGCRAVAAVAREVALGLRGVRARRHRQAYQHHHRQTRADPAHR